MIKEKIKKLVENAVRNMGASNALVFIDIPKEKNRGDYTTTIALALFKTLQQNPLEVANTIVSKIQKEKLFEKVEVVSPGFINFYLEKSVISDSLQQVLKEKDAFGKNQLLKNKKFIVEYTDPNPFKEFHIGHLVTNSIGESIARLTESEGAVMKRANYQGDVGIHVAKAIFGKLKNPTYGWQESYVYGSTLYEKSDEAKKEIVELNKKIYERSDKKINSLYDHGKKESLAYFEKVYKILGTKFDYYFFESEVSNFGKKTVADGLKKGIFETGETGAVIFKGEEFDLHTRVFINSEGLPTYEAKELGLAKIKYSKFHYDQSVVVTGKEINEYFKVLLCVMEKIFPDLAEKTKHIGHGMMRLPSGKMSSRTGDVVTFEFLLHEVEKLVEEKIKARQFLEKEKKEIVEMVAIAALKYSILKQSIGSDIVYDFEKSISFEGDSGPYLQYSYARARSVLRKATAEKIKPLLKVVPSETSQLEKMMMYFPEIVEKAGKEYQPHYIASYLTELAHEFNSYYASNKIVDKDDEFSSYKVALTEAFSIIMKNGLWLLGISAPERM